MMYSLTVTLRDLAAPGYRSILSMEEADEENAPSPELMDEIKECIMVAVQRTGPGRPHEVGITVGTVGDE